MEGKFSQTINSKDLVLDYNHPLNPFKHRYHPDHNNLDERFEDTLANGIESYTITRNLTLEFYNSIEAANENENPTSLPGYGATLLDGIYREKLTGLHKNDLYVEGDFRLLKVSSIEWLDSVIHINNIPSDSPLGKAVSIDGSTPTLLTSNEINNVNTQISVYPNPITNNALLIEGLEFGSYQVEILDLFGIKVLDNSISASTNRIQVPQLAEGFYILKIIQNSSLIFSQKIAIINP